jgi:hypothetical protein
MIKVIINGACGRMGKEVEKIVEASEVMTVAAKIDKMAAESGCYTDINDFNGEADIIIDFSNHLGTKDLLDYAVKNNIVDWAGNVISVNYMFSLSPENPLLDLFYKIIPHPYWYMYLAAIPMVTVLGIVYIRDILALIKKRYSK